MSSYTRYARLIGVLALLLAGCSLLPELPTLRDLLQGAEDHLPLAPIGGIPIEIEALVAFDNRHLIDGTLLDSYTGEWTHIQEGRLLTTIGWQPHRDRVEGAYGGGRHVCYYDWGDGRDPATPHWTVQWSGALAFDDPRSGIIYPLIEVAIYGDEALVLYALPREFYYPHPGSPDDCQNPDPVEAHQATGPIAFYLEDVAVERPPDAETSTKTVRQNGMVLLRLPLERLRAGVSETGTVDLTGADRGYYGTTEWGLRITLTLTSSPGGQ